MMYPYTRTKTTLLLSLFLLALLPQQDLLTVVTALDLNNDESSSSTTTTTADSSPFSIIFDGGSTGSRLHVFEFVKRPREEDEDADDDDDEEEEDIVRRGSFRVDRPLSVFAVPEDDGKKVNATAVAEYVMPALIFARDVIPSHYHATTRVYYQATAGMRLLSDQQQQDVYDAMFNGIVQWNELSGSARNDFVFTGIRRSDIATLSGDLEGYYGAVAANYLKGTIRPNLQLQQPSAQQGQQRQQLDDIDDNNNTNHHHARHGPIGALDMGGSSTQIVFLPASASTTSSSQTKKRGVDYQHCTNINPNNNMDGGNNSHDSRCSHVEDVEEEEDHYAFPTHLDDKDFFTTSYLSYGVDQFRERLWNTWIKERKAQIQNDDDTCDSKILANPCCFKGYEIEWQGYTLVGTSDTHRCIEEVRRLIPHPENHDDPSTTTTLEKSGKRVVGGVEHPPIRGKFFAMSLYFFTLDCLREMSHANKDAHDALNSSWPNPSIQELVDALDGLCSRSWHGDLEHVQHNVPHAYTRPEVLPHRCLEAVYMVTLLRDGFGFAPESRDITFTFLVDGSEVEWTLGMALVLRAQQQQEQQEEEKLQAVPVTDSEGEEQVEGKAIFNTCIAKLGVASDGRATYIANGDCVTSDSSSSPPTPTSEAIWDEQKNDTLEQDDQQDDADGNEDNVLDDASFTVRVFQEFRKHAKQVWELSLKQTVRWQYQ